MKNRKKIIFYLGLGLFFFSVFMIIFPSKVADNIKNVMLNFRGNIFPININGEKINAQNIKTLENDIIVLSDTSLSYFSNDTSKNFNKPHSFTSPFLKCREDKILIYDLFGNGFKINKKSEEILSSKLEDNILSGDISKNGNYVFSIQSKEFLNQICVFSENFKEIFKYSLSDCYINNVSINKSGDIIAASGVSSCGGKLKSIIYFFDIKKEEPRARFEYDDTMFLGVNFFENSNVIAIGDKITVVFKDFKEQTVFSYDKKPITCFDISSFGAVLSLSSKSDFSDCNLITISDKGDIFPPIKIGFNVNAISYNDDIIAVLCPLKIFICRYDKIFKTIPLENDVKNIRLVSSKSVYLLGVSNINLFNFNL